MFPNLLFFVKIYIISIWQVAFEKSWDSAEVLKELGLK